MKIMRLTKNIFLFFIVSIFFFCNINNSPKLLGIFSLLNQGVSVNSTYTIGGRVSGLAGTLVLQNNGGDNLNLTSNGTFTFLTGITSGSTYSVSVLNQPSGQTCAVSGNAGTVVSSNITNITITCSTTTLYSVGGSLSGLLGTLVLQNNGGDNLSLTADGNFTFSTNLANGSTYSVTILTQPSTKTCVITNSSGSISSTNITNISIVCVGNANGVLASGTIINSLTLTGGVTTFVGAPCAANTAGCSSPNGYVDSSTTSSVRFSGAEGLTTDGYYLYIADKSNERIRKVSIATGQTTTLAGDGTQAILDGTGTGAQFDDPKYLVTDGVNLYVSDKNNKAIRKVVLATGVVTTIISGSTSLQDPKGLLIYNNYLYVGDNSGNAIRQIDLTTSTLSTVLTGLNDPTSMTLVGTDIYIADKNSDTIKKTTIGTWSLTTFAGTTQGFSDGTGTTGTQFRNPEGITTDGTNLYVADTGNNAIRKIVISSAVVTTLAGTNTANYTNSSTSTNARFDGPRGITSDGAMLYVMDKNNNAIRLIQ